MKKIKLLLSFVATILLATSSFSQSKNKEVSNETKIVSLKVKGEAATVLQKLKMVEPSFTISKEGILKPMKGYQIRYAEKIDKYVITRVGAPEKKPIANDGTVNLGHGIMLHCYSDNNCENCQPDNVDGWYCKTSGCECLMEVFVLPSVSQPEKLGE